MDKKVIKSIKAIGLIGGLSSFIWVLFIDWRIGIGVFFMIWANNISEKSI